MTDATTQTRKETPEQKGIRLAEESIDVCAIQRQKVVSTIRKKLSARVRLPRAQGSMRVRLKLDVVPRRAIQKLCEESGLTVTPWRRRGKAAVREWKAAGPKATAQFASLGGTHRLALGGAKLMAPGKGAKKRVCRVVTLLAPPLTVVERTSKDEESATISGYLVTCL